jgi:hypothetical protein
MTNFLRTALLGVSLATSSFAFAQSGPPPTPPPGEGAPGEGAPGDFAKVRLACHDDIARLCKDVPPGDGRVRECLRAHKDELSEGCRTAIREARAHHHPRRDPN